MSNGVKVSFQITTARVTTRSPSRFTKYVARIDKHSRVYENLVILYYLDLIVRPQWPLAHTL